jgi:hypothetical protein
VSVTNVTHTRDISNPPPAEDNPTNDYPDEELSSDDEFNRNPYRYYHGRESDDDDDDKDDYNNDFISYEDRNNTAY